MYNPQDGGQTPPPPAGPRPPLGVIRGIFAAIGVVVMVLTGGCALAFLLTGASLGDLSIILGVAGIPFLVGLGIFLLATRAGR